MKYLLAIFLLLLSGLANASQAMSGRPALTAVEARDMFEAGKLTIVDIRRPEEWRGTGVADGVVRINMLHPGGPKGFMDELLRQVGGNKDAPIGLICRTGNRTSTVQRYLMSQGFSNVYNIREGMAGSGAGPGWLARGLPVDPCTRC